MELINAEAYNKFVAEGEAFSLGYPQVDVNTEHLFEPGVYRRRVTIPAGTFAIGHHQKTRHVNHMISGKVLMLQSDGTTKIIEAPQTFVGAPGRKCGYIIEDVVWDNIYLTDETDVSKLEATYIDKSNLFMNYETYQTHLDRIDYKKFIAQLCLLDGARNHNC